MTRDSDVEELPGDPLVREFLWIHSMVRHDLQAVRDLVDAINSGVATEAVQDTIRSLQTLSPLWQLRVNCLRYCRFVHAHHGLEDVQLFPALRRSDPSLGPTVDRLEADHRAVSDLLDDVEALAVQLGPRDDEGVRAQLVNALEKLSDVLLAHLEFEEGSIIPTMRGWTHWPI
jgi:hypothetical protein